MGTCRVTQCLKPVTSLNKTCRTFLAVELLLNMTTYNITK